MFRHKIYAIFFRQLVNKTTDCFNNIAFILVTKISFKKLCEKIENNSTLEKDLLVYNRNAELLRLVGASFDSKVASFRRMRMKILREVRLFFICLSLFIFELSNINWKYSEHIYMLTEHTHYSAVFEIFVNIITIYLLLNTN